MCKLTIDEMKKVGAAQLYGHTTDMDDQIQTLQNRLASSALDSYTARAISHSINRLRTIKKVLLSLLSECKDRESKALNYHQNPNNYDDDPSRCQKIENDVILSKSCNPCAGEFI